MINVRRVVLFCLFGLLATAAMPTVLTAAPAFKDVIVQNTSDNPVPTSAIGTTEVEGSVEVSNLPAVQQVGGTVDIGNLPAVQQVEVTNMAGPEPQYGNGLIDTDEGWVVDVPPGVVLTDAIVLPMESFSQFDECVVVLFDGDNGLHEFVVTEEAEKDELHLESGIATTGPGLSFVSFDGADPDCRTHVLWTGYTAP